MTKKIRLLLIAVLVILPILLMLSACGECEHANLTDEKVITPATCTADGKGSHVCADCQEIIEFVIPATGHTEVVDAGVDYTCTADGITEGKHCSTCNEVLVAQQVLPAAHRPTEWIITKPVSCEIDGYRIKNCTVCEERVASEAITKTGHLESDWEITKAAACEATGAKRTTCLNCQEVMQTAVIDALGHDKTDWIVTTAPTCLSSGLRHKGCTRCEKTFDQESVAALGHFCTTTVVAPTCTTDGYTEEKCTRCTYSRNIDPVAKNGHSYTETVVAPTRNERGYTQHTCNNCAEGTDGHSYKDNYVAPLGHQYDSGVVTAPTCLESGYTTYSCIRCEAGTQGHSYKDNYVTPLDHHYDNGIITQPTCIEQGYTTYTCIRCAEGTEGHSYKDTYTNPLGHSYIEKIDKNPTCTAAGSKHNECVRCQVQEPGSTQAIVATGHQIVTNTYTKEMGDGTRTTRVATVDECVAGDYVHIRQIVFNYSNPNREDRLGANEGFSYGMSVDCDDLLERSTTKQSLPANFALTTTFTTKHATIPTTAEAHLCITTAGSIDKALGFVGGIDDKTTAFNNALDYADGKNGSATYVYNGNPSAGTLKGRLYFVFTNQNQFASYTIKSISATATFTFSEPKVN